MNDPNGMVYYKGEYHLFYQHYPEKSVWGPMHWGHAISTDLVHWEHMPIAIYPDSLGYIFSGSAVADYNNTSGLGTKENPPLVAFFTYHDMKAEKEGRFTEIESQAIAYSLDKGRTWTKYKGNPVVKNPGIRDFRDPKVIWHNDSKQWIMSIASGQVIKFYSSPNCLDWTYLSEFGEGRGEHGGVWECPDLFPLQVKGSNETKWVLIVNINPGGPAGGSATQYFVGDFNGKEFISAQSKTQWMDYGKDNYAGVTWSNAPPPIRRISPNLK
jgi:fructan beta-fructosidase